jgi:RNA polymerase sigma-54 factor
MTEFSLELQPALRQSVNSSLIEANHILSLPLLELERVVAGELAANPALEQEERPRCATCGRPLAGDECPICATGRPPVDRLTLVGEAIARRRAVAGSDRGDEIDPLLFVAAERPLAERLLADLALVLPRAELAVAERLLECLDERGWLDVSTDQVAAATGRPVALVEGVLRAIQQAAPPGVAARDLRECLRLQLAHWRQQTGREPPAGVDAIVAGHLDDLAQHRYGAIARRLRLSRQAVEAARDFIRTQLRPYPLHEPEGHPRLQPTTTLFAAPDAIIHARDGGYQVEIVESLATSLSLNPVYARLAAEVAHDRWRLSADERDHVRQSLTRARLFLARIRLRHETLRRLTECLVESQGDFLREGVRALRPLTRAMLAERLGVHESTVSRATADKYVLLPDRRVVAYDVFFKASLSVQEAIRELVAGEQAALTDRDISDRLRLAGYRVARRTIAKYRAQLGILPSTYR